MADQNGARAGIEEILGYTFQDPTIVYEAVSRERNPRLAFLGDKVVGLILLDIWYRTETSCAQGYSRLQDYATNKAMAHQAIRLHLDAFAAPGPSQSQRATLGTHGLGTEIEALVAATWIDSRRNFEVVKSVMKNLHLCPDHA